MIRQAVLLALVAGVLTLLALAVSMGRAEARHRHSCTHGESSIVAIQIAGRLHVSKPTFTGCLP